ncbi:MAG: hypothetical protein L0H75_08540, partial [Nitrosospira sp.]|nr:hypothetical protein [Nitrosospira sp.]
MTNARSDARRRRLLLHVGLPKTGTSALQRWLHENPARLEAAGICYPGAPYLNGDKHQFLVSELRHGGQSLERLLSSTTHDTVLLSSEGLSNHFHDFSEQGLQRFRHLTANFRVEIVLVTREKTA